MKNWVGLKRWHIPVKDVVSAAGPVVEAVVEEMAAVVLRDWPPLELAWAVVEDTEMAVEVDGGDGGGYP